MRQFYHPQMKLEQGYVFTRVCHSVHKGGWYPSMPCTSPSPHPGGLRGLAREDSRPTPEGSPGPHPGGISRPTLGGGVFRPTYGEGVSVSEHALRQTPPPLHHDTGGSTRPTGMHSCTNVNLVIRHKKREREKEMPGKLKRIH